MPYAGLGDLEDLRRTKEPRHGEFRERFTVVGYGGSFVGEPPPWEIEYLDHRAIAQSAFRNLLDAWLRVSQHQSRGDEGTCYGDSGGPILRDVQGTEIVVGITSWGDTPCVSMGSLGRRSRAGLSFMPGIIASSSGNASVTPDVRRNVRRGMCRFVRNDITRYLSCEFDRTETSLVAPSGRDFVFIWNGGLLTMPSTRDEKRWSWRAASRATARTSGMSR